MSSRFGVVLAASGLLLAAFAGYVKGSSLVQSVLPVDPTLFGVVVTGLAVLVAISRRRITSPRGTALVVALAGSFLIGWQTDFSSTVYTITKVQSLYLISLPCILGGLLLLRSAMARRIWLRLIVVLGALVGALAVIDPNLHTAKLGDRIAIEGANTISAGRATGAAVVVLLCLFLGRAPRRPLLFGGAAVLSIAMVSSGSRGPLLSGVVAVLTVALFSSGGRRLRRAVLGGSAVAVAAWVATSFGLVSDRLSQTDGLSSQYRVAMWLETSGLIAQRPMGIGWGNLYFHLSASTSPDSGVRQYPHNIVLEIAAEAGWIACGVFLLAVIVALRWQRRATTSPVEMAMFGVFLFYLGSAMVSGDVNDNRGVWVMLGAALATAPARSAERDPVPKAVTPNETSAPQWRAWL